MSRRTIHIRRRAVALVVAVIVAGIVAVAVPKNAAPSLTPAPTTDYADQTAGATLQKLAVKGRAPKTGYARDQFGQGWGTLDGCDTRQTILRRDLTGVVLGSDGCAVESGTLADPYTGKSIAFTRGASTSGDVQIDHVVALGDAWQTGAQQLDAGTRENLANDPLELLAVDGPANEQKSDGDAATWLPPNKGFRCYYVARQIAVKAKYGMWVTPSEHDAMNGVLSGCPQQKLPR